MSARAAGLLLLLSAIWGASFMFIKLSVDDLAPSMVVLGRLVVGGLVLLPIVAARGGLSQLRGALGPILLLGAFNNVVPFWLLAFAGERIDSGLSAEIQASAPLVVVVLARWVDPSQRIRGLRLAGVLAGFVGVTMLVGGQSGGQLLAALAVVGTASCYAASVLFVGRRLHHLPLTQLAFGQIAAATAMAAPFAALQAPGGVPGAGALAAVVALGALGTGIAYLLYFALIKRAGASRAILVTYLVPAFALGYGALFLDEGITGMQVAGLVLVLAGSAVATGLVARRRARVDR